MSIATRITSIEEHIGDIYDTLELGGADLTNTDKNLVNVKSILKQKYLDYMNNGTREIWNNWEKVPTGTGENVTLNNTVQAPMDVTVKGNSEQVQYSGKQLLPFTNQNVTLGGVTFKAVNGRLILNGTATENINGSYFLTDNFKVSLGSGNYVLSRTNVNSNLTIMLMLLDGTVVAQLPRTISDLSVSLTIASANNYYIAFYIPAGSTFNNYDSGVMVSTTGGAYEPYTYGQALNPNFEVPIQNVSGDVEVLVRDTKIFDKFTIQAGDIINNNATIRLCSRQEMWIKAGTYTFTTNITSPFRYLVGIENVGVPPISNYPNYIYNSEWQTSSSLTFTINEPGYFTLQLSKTANAQLTVDEVMNFDYSLTAHEEQTFTFPLGTQRMYAGDYLADDGIHHVKKQVVFDGTETWSQRTNSNGIRQFYCNTSATNVVMNNQLCNYGKFSSFAFNWGNVGTFALLDNTHAFHLNVSNEIELNTFKNTIAENNLVVEYPLSTEEITPYTTEQQTVYDEIKQAISYEEQTNVSGTSDESNPIFEVTALKNV